MERGDAPLKDEPCQIGRVLVPARPGQRQPWPDWADGDVVRAFTERGIAASWQMPAANEGTMPDGAVIIAAITSCTNTSNPSVLIAAGLGFSLTGDGLADLLSVRR